MVQSKLKGFTIIELLVVLAIAALLLSFTFALFSNARSKSRDATREAHMKTLQNALTLYATNNKTYPTTSGQGIDLTGADSVSTALKNSGAIASIPLDPLNASPYIYHYVSVDGITYTITYYLETSSVPGKNAGQQQVSQ